jgi:hypothetical protein
LTTRATMGLLLLTLFGFYAVQFAPAGAASPADAPDRPLGTVGGCPVQFPITMSEGVRVALVNSILTSSAYSNVSYPGVPGFYDFYMKYKHVSNVSSVTTDLSWLTVPLSTSWHYNWGWGDSYPIYKFMTSDFAKRCGLQSFYILDDTQVDAGSLFNSNGSRRYDVVVMGKSEYVTSNELDQYLTFVKSGGRLVLMNSDNFEVQVKLGFCHGLCETFVNGHGWTFGNAMVHSRVWNAFPLIDSKLTASLLPEQYYVGSNIGVGHVHNNTMIGLMLYRAFGAEVLSNYTAHEESRLVNRTGTAPVIAFSYGINSFVHRYGQGDVVCFCLEGSRIIRADAVAEQFLILSISTWRATLHRMHVWGAYLGNGLPQLKDPSRTLTSTTFRLPGRCGQLPRMKIPSASNLQNPNRGN